MLNYSVAELRLFTKEHLLYCVNNRKHREQKKKEKIKNKGYKFLFFFFISSYLSISTASYLEMDSSYSFLVNKDTSSAFARSITEVSIEDK